MAQRTTPPELPGFTHLGWIGGGGFADVFRYQDAMGRSVAVKVQHRGVDESSSAAFHAEANLMAKLSTHPNIVTIHTSGVSDDGRPFLVMEECNSAHLGARISKRTHSVSKAMEVTIQVAGAIETAHRMGILHRDVKPANILFTEFGRPALTDFGISVAGDSTTASGGLSPLWAPPEQYPDSELTMGPWSDVFSLAATTWAMLVGRSPLEVPGGANDRLSLRHRVRSFQPSRTGRTDVPEVVERILQTALARDPEQRYRSVVEFARALQGAQGQLNVPVTPVDVLDERADQHEHDDDGDTGTRVSGFMLIDPEIATGERTITSTSEPLTGDTVLTDHSRDDQTGPGEHSLESLPAETSPRAPVQQHGRGYAEAGLRDFTAPPLPQDQSPSVRDSQYAAARQAREEPSGSRAKTWLSVAGVVVLLAGGIGVWQAGVFDDDVEEAQPTQPTVAPPDPVVARVSPVEELEGEVSDDEVVFTWINPDPQPADKYFVEELSPAVEDPNSLIDEPEISVEQQPGQTCVNVSVRRGNGHVSAPVRACVDS